MKITDLIFFICYEFVLCDNVQFDAQPNIFTPTVESFSNAQVSEDERKNLPWDNLSAGVTVWSFKSLKNGVYQFSPDFVNTPLAIILC